MTELRPIREEDAGAFLALCRQLDEETHFMMLEPGERTTTVEQQQDRIRQVLKRENQIILVAEDAEKLVGYISGMGGDYRRNEKTVHIVIGILQSYTGQGIGKRFFQALEEWAVQHDLHRLELTVMTHNQRGIALYQRMGFEVEGVKRDDLFVDGGYIDQYMMAKLLS
ncbi:acetyltransferase [Longilinea arvoryzae]|uniref:Acetyltransferase n=1 Tax=Longilinea arvoryzae TaxID=360412 RepID=A0A0S7B998_9CHLR|nr:GNAT family protein [Longilinea arvoryzae]GAP13838.1 acetyltransferase [Longilinea arvoryzae]